MKYVAVYRQTYAKMVSIEADSIEEAEERIYDAAMGGVFEIERGDWVCDDDEVRFIDNPCCCEIEAAFNIE